MVSSLTRWEHSLVQTWLFGLQVQWHVVSSVSKWLLGLVYSWVGEIMVWWVLARPVFWRLDWCLLFSNGMLVFWKHLANLVSRALNCPLSWVEGPIVQGPLVSLVSRWLFCPILSWYAGLMVEWLPTNPVFWGFDCTVIFWVGMVVL